MGTIQLFSNYTHRSAFSYNNDMAKKKNKKPVKKAQVETKQQKREEPQPQTKKEVTRKRSLVSIMGFGLFACLAILYLSANIYASQNVHPIFSSLVNNDTQSWVSFFKIIRTDDKTKSYLDTVPETYLRLQPELNQDNSTRLEMIANLEQTLTLNPNARDVLLAIATLYKESGNELKSAEYLERAQRIDPLVSID